MTAVYIYVLLITILLDVYILINIIPTIKDIIKYRKQDKLDKKNKNL